MQKILDLGMHPFADTFVPADKLHLSEPVLPLQVGLTSETGEVKLMMSTDAYKRYNLYEYSYTSANSSFSRNHWTQLARHLSATVLGGRIHSRILEIGCNDGFLLEQFVEQGFRNVSGIDASNKLVDFCRAKGLNVVGGIFRNEQRGPVPFDLIVANNVVNHANDPVEFFHGIVRNLSEDGTFVFELPYWVDTVVSRRIEQVYHEHITYFTAKYAQTLCQAVGLYIADFELVNYHGGSIRFYVKKGTGLNDKVRAQIEYETSLGVFDPKFYEELSRKMKENRIEVLQRIYNIKKQGFPIVAVGAAAKGNTLLNYLNLDHKTIDFVTDGSVHKIGKYTPLSRIPIVSDEILATLENPHVFFLAWNIEAILLPMLKKINPNITVIESSL